MVSLGKGRERKKKEEKEPKNPFVWAVQPQVIVHSNEKPILNSLFWDSIPEKNISILFEKSILKRKITKIKKKHKEERKKKEGFPKKREGGSKRT